jgi:ubiquitin-like modifier-activating enzyme ATG7
MHRSLRCVGKLKAVAAADKLNRILPAMEARAEVLGIPMPGHFVQTSGKEYDETVAAIHKLSALIAEHDVIFMLLDTREARWLPTVLSTLHEKVAVNAALGFDSYMVRAQPFHSSAAVLQPISAVVWARTLPFLWTDRPQVMRHGVRGGATERLGCYFCNDVVSPKDSTTNRTLDQQCTVRVPPLPHAVRAWVRHCR